MERSERVSGVPAGRKVRRAGAGNGDEERRGSAELKRRDAGVVVGSLDCQIDKLTRDLLAGTRHHITSVRRTSCNPFVYCSNATIKAPRAVYALPEVGLVARYLSDDAVLLLLVLFERSNRIK